ncbi:hypothetical protein K432DRAFT_302162 [Lepidopterella palustris CBS 459.81]|uniref:CST complex subunit Stn1 N-terminal domain-containing protein n=1 Tax=Lepidopterella palustris CBS 459.81 TaxID=1314670 RepID=A0A8E2E6W2_9PEZI|nr:hypothetical protein K432DRAFT_302162 [Lepidopterella palustris CBS 459.81]
MTTLPSISSHPIYPAYCFRVSPTYNAWVKLTIADVHTLRAEHGYEGQNIYWHLNHPIRFVRLVGVIVAIDDINAKYTILTLDDSSGATIEVKITRLPTNISTLVECPSNTTVSNVHVAIRRGVFEVEVDGQNLDIGTVIKAKCTIAEFRGNKQLELKRVSVVRSTDEEVRAWAETARFRKDVLEKSWVLSERDQKQIKKELKMQWKKEKEHQRLKAEHDARRLERNRTRDEKTALSEQKAERRRKKEEVIMNTGALI